MSKDTYYFQHDYNARTDMKIRKVIAKHGYLGYGIFWAIIEDLYNNANALQLDYDLIASDLKTKKHIAESIINDFDLFVICDGYFSSNSVQSRLDKRDEKSFKAKESAKKRWESANAMRTHTDGNAIKEKKGKEKKGNNNTNSIELRKKEFSASLKPFLEKYGKETLNDFYSYWTEPNKSGTLFRKEMERTWNTAGRLRTWAKRDFNSVKAKPKVSAAVDQSNNQNLFQ